jgi:hypothetical protein
MALMMQSQVSPQTMRLCSFVSDASCGSLSSRRSVKGARVGVLGLTFKEDSHDLRTSKVPDITRARKLTGNGSRKLREKVPSDRVRRGRTRPSTAASPCNLGRAADRDWTGWS